uniref:Chromosome 1 open reading frame 159 n=1 Tax=Latimeria chalumnae TaxID=7897 RepID=M3XLB4_LATCH|nr:PREDICTED: uncharacterized protein C1orf159 homolog isoform X1 [Latimeria chalumnae]|eukprot:XP_014342957.1 PREDICTED: uncharacterized protein C1orf159 homolog isoform X1 [Latimeria chalumnae]
MAVPYILIMVGIAVRVSSETPGSSVSQEDCCVGVKDVNGTCPVNNQCRTGCYRHWYENGTTTCTRCRNETFADNLNNVTECHNLNSTEIDPGTSTSTILPTLQKVGGPAVAASLLLGTLFISLFLILSVASFFYLKRSNKLPNIFYRRNKASVLQPSEPATVTYTPPSSVRKPRYVRRERPSVMSPTATLMSSIETRVSNV